VMTPHLVENLRLSVLGLATLGTFCLIASLWGRHARRRLEMAHEQRLKALELGAVLPEDPPRSAAVAFGLGVPATAFVLASLTSLLTTVMTGGDGTVWTDADLRRLAKDGSRTVLASQVRGARPEVVLSVEGAPVILTTYDGITSFYGRDDGMWAATGGVGALGVLCGTALAFRSGRRPDRPKDGGYSSGSDFGP